MRRSFLVILSFILASCSSGTRVVFSDPVLPPPGGFPNIFKSYTPKKDAVMMPGWARNFDMSGVSFDQRMTATLVTRRHVVMAAHYVRRLGSQVIFHDRNGKRLERTIVKVQKLPADVAVGLLNMEVPSNYRVYPLPRLQEDYSNLIGETAVITDQNRRLFFHEIRRAKDHLLSFTYPVPSRHGFAKKLVSGDSGNPSFLIRDHELVLIGTHTSGGPGSGPFYGSALVQEKLQSAISAMSPGYKLRFKAL